MDEQELDYLLAKGRLSGAQKERVIDSVLDSTARQERRGLRALVRKPWLWTLSGATAAAVLLATVVLGDPEPPAFRARGVAAGNQVLIEAGCADGCNFGDTLMFRVDGVSSPAFLASFAVSGSGKRIWHFPSDEGEMLAVPAANEPVMLARGVRLGSEHQPGLFQLHLLLTRAEMSREQLDQALDEGDTTAFVAHTVQPLRVEP